ncbi:MAG: NHL repeat-containing protein [Desulfobacula sp.]|nr:NHL repeat-containing protein [Desulfobacula sp.]
MIRLIFFCITLLVLPVTDTYGINLIPATKLFEITRGLNEPSDVAVSPRGLIYIVDGVNNKIKIFSSSGKFISSFGKKGKGPGQFLYPLGIDIDQTGKVFIADSQNHRVQTFNSKGMVLSQINIPSKTSKLSDPTDVAVDEKKNRFYVVDNDNHKVLVYDLSTLNLIKTYGKPGTGKREFRYPFLMAVDSESYLYIVDVINTRVQVLNSEGLYVTDIGGWGVEKGQFFRPKGIAIDKKNRVYVSDSYMGVIQIFETTGELFAAIGDAATGSIMRFKTPMGLFVDEKNRLFVVEMFANKVSVFQMKANP